MASVNNYRVYCNTESAYVTYWNTIALNVCPNNNTHSVDTNSISIINIVGEQTVDIKEESIPTGGFFRSESMAVTVPANTIYTWDTSWRYPITALQVSFVTGEALRGDNINCLIAPNTICGILTTGVSSGSTSVTVNSTVTTNIKTGFLCTITNGINTSELGEVISVNKNNNTLITSNSIGNSFSAGAYVMLSIHNIKNFEITDPNTYIIGSGKIGGSYVPANTIIRLKYNNKSLTDEKRFVWSFEYLY